MVGAGETMGRQEGDFRDAAETRPVQHEGTFGKTGVAGDADVGHDGLAGGGNIDAAGCESEGGDPEGRDDPGLQVELDRPLDAEEPMDGDVVFGAGHRSENHPAAAIVPGRTPVSSLYPTT